MPMNEVDFVSKAFTFNQCPIVLAQRLNIGHVRSILLQTGCFLDVQSRVLNARHRATPWTKGSVLQVTGPSYDAIDLCNEMIESKLAFYRDRRIYDERQLIENDDEVKQLLSQVIGSEYLQDIHDSKRLKQPEFGQIEGSSIVNQKNCLSLCRQPNGTPTKNERVTENPILEFQRQTVCESGAIGGQNRNEHNMTDPSASGKVVCVLRVPKTRHAPGKSGVKHRRLDYRSFQTRYKDEGSIREIRSSPKERHQSEIRTRSCGQYPTGDDRLTTTAFSKKVRDQPATNAKRCSVPGSPCSGRYSAARRCDTGRDSGNVQHGFTKSNPSIRYTPNTVKRRASRARTPRSPISGTVSMRSDTSVNSHKINPQRSQLESHSVKILDTPDPVLYYACAAGQSITSDESASTFPTTMLANGHYKGSPEQIMSGFRSEAPEFSYGSCSRIDNHLKCPQAEPHDREYSPISARVGSPMLNSHISPIPTPGSHRSTIQGVVNRPMTKCHSEVEYGNYAERLFSLMPGQLKSNTLIPTILVQNVQNIRCGDREPSPVSFHQPYSTSLTTLHPISLTKHTSDVGDSYGIPMVPFDDDYDDTKKPLDDSQDPINKSGITRRLKQSNQPAKGMNVRRTRSAHRPTERTGKFTSKSDHTHINPLKPQITKHATYNKPVRTRSGESVMHKNANDLSTNLNKLSNKVNHISPQCAAQPCVQRPSSKQSTDREAKSVAHKPITPASEAVSDLARPHSWHDRTHLLDAFNQKEINGITKTIRTLTINGSISSRNVITPQESESVGRNEDKQDRLCARPIASSQVGKESKSNLLEPIPSKPPTNQTDSTKESINGPLNRGVGTTPPNSLTKQEKLPDPQPERTKCLSPVLFSVGLPSARNSKEDLSLLNKSRVIDPHCQTNEKDRLSMTPSRLPRPSTSSATLAKIRGSREALDRSISEKSDSNKFGVKSRSQPYNETKQTETRPASALGLPKTNNIKAPKDATSSSATSNTSDSITSTISGLSSDEETETEEQSSVVVRSPRPCSRMTYSSRQEKFVHNRNAKPIKPINSPRIYITKAGSDSSKEKSTSEKVKTTHPRKSNKLLKFIWGCMPWANNNNK